MNFWSAFLAVVAASAIALDAVAIGDAKETSPLGPSKRHLCTNGCWYCKC
jgi:hypothetical protein